MTDHNKIGYQINKGRHLGHGVAISNKNGTTTYNPDGSITHTDNDGNTTIMRKGKTE